MRQYHFSPLLLALLPALLVQLVWLAHNTQLPMSDATGSLVAAHRLAELALTGQWADFLSGLYTLRDWRPTSLALVETPFLILTGNRLLEGISLMTLACTAASITYAFRLLALALPAAQASLAACLLGLLPELQWPATFFGFTEAPFMPAMLAALYYLIRSDGFQNKPQSYRFAFAALLAFSLRPVEALLQLTPAIAFCIWRSHISRAEIFATVTASLLCASVLVLAGWWPNGLFVLPHSAIFNEPLQGALFFYGGSAILLATALACGLLAYRLARQAEWRAALSRHSALLPSLSLTSLGVALFYFPFMTQLVQWIYITNFGDLSSLSAPLTAGERLLRIVLCAAPVPLAVIAALALSMRKPLRGHILLPLLATTPFMLITPFVTCQYSPRKMTVLFTCVLIVSLSLALREGKALRARVLILVLLACMQAAGLFWIGTARGHTPLLTAVIGAREAYPDMVTTRPNPHDVLSAFLLDTAKRHGYGMIALPLPASDAAPRLADPFLLQAMVKMQGTGSAVYRDIRVTGPALENDLHRQLGADAFLLAPSLNLDAAGFRKLADAAWTTADKAAYELLALHAEGTLTAHKRECIALAVTEACIYDFK